MACYGPLSVCFGQTGFPRECQMGVRKGFQTSLKRGPPQNEQNLVSYTICYVSDMSTVLKNTDLGDCFASPQWGPQRGQQKTPLKHIPGGSHGHLGGFAVDFRVLEGSLLEAKSFNMSSWNTCPTPWSAKVDPRWPLEDPRAQK